jgi:F0F1-type ATP synthase membrane subunit a
MNMNKLNEIFGSPRTWALIIALAFILTSAFWPGMPLNKQDVTGAVVALVAFIVSVSVAGNPTDWKKLLSTLRFWVLITNLAFIFIRAFWATCPISQEQVLAIISALGTTSVGISYRPINETR